MLVMSYFTAADEALHLALSSDGRVFVPVNRGEPVLRGTVGTCSLRDPFIGVGPGGLYHLLATDGWSSPYIVHASSEDLLTWSEQELLPVMSGIAGAHNAWAPEFFYDPQTDLYHLIWSSVVDADVASDHRDWQNTGQDHRIWHCTTKDFVTFSTAEVFFDPAYSVIDATVVWYAGSFTMAFKDERGHNDVATEHKHILLTTFTDPKGTFTDPIGPVSPGAAEGPTLFRRGDEWVLLFDHYLEDRYGGVSSRDGHNWTPTDIAVPAGIRHASVLELEGPPRWLGEGVV